MTGYHITVGYNSCWSTAEVREELLSVVDFIRRHPEHLVAEVRRLEPRLDEAKLIDLAESYRPSPTPDLTIEIREAEGDVDVAQLASGGGASRSIKEALRRAFCRMVLEAMHRKEMEINITVT